MPGWLLRPGATFDVYGVETANDLVAGTYRLQPKAWLQISRSDSYDPGVSWASSRTSNVRKEGK
jgi:hypothetical protein